MELRPYQIEAVEAVWEHLRAREDNPVIVLPTAAGKTPVMATLARQAVTNWQGKVLILAHVKELLQQGAEKLSLIAPDVSFGVYSAGLKSRDLGYPVTIAGIQSVYDKAEQLGHIDIVMIDEAHRIPSDGEGMYRTLLESLKQINPAIRLIGLTATPYRTGSGMIVAPENLLNHIAYEVSIRKLIVDKFICKVISKTTRSAKVDTSKLHVRAGEFVAEEVDALMNNEHLMALAAMEIGEKTEDRKSILVFSPNVAHAKSMAQMITDVTGDKNIGTIFGDTPSDERAETLRRFKARQIRYLVNVSVLTEGFDAPNIDAVCILRPTLSPGLYYQMVGRGFRLFPDKQDCLVLDFGGNVLRHGPVDMIQPKAKRDGSIGSSLPTKECPECQSVIAIGYTKCPDCGYEWPVKEPKHEGRPGEEDILSKDDYTLDVEEVQYALHRKAGDENAKPTLRVEYHIVRDLSWISEWVCLEHIGFARDKAASWWRKRSDKPVPATIAEALEIIKSEGIKEPVKITYKPEGKYRRIISWHGLGERVRKDDDADIPF